MVLLPTHLGARRYVVSLYVNVRVDQPTSVVISDCVNAERISVFVPLDRVAPILGIRVVEVLSAPLEQSRDDWRGL
jgi:hypothetical protein